MRYKIVPTENQTFRIVGGRGDEALAARLEASRRLQAEGHVERACEARFAAFQDIADALPEEEIVDLDATHAQTFAAMEIMHDSAIDSYLAGEAELAAAQFELLLDCDGEDHLESTPALALCYAALQDWDCLDEIGIDLDDRSPLKALLGVWRSFCTAGKASDRELAALRRHKAVVEEFLSADHPTDEAYLRDISSERPSQQALARELWLRCQPALAATEVDLVGYLREALL